MSVEGARLNALAGIRAIDLVHCGDGRRRIRLEFAVDTGARRCRLLGHLVEPSDARDLVRELVKVLDALAIADAGDEAMRRLGVACPVCRLPYGSCPCSG